jgi:tRNA-(ms[2]io[6]A)-hydroxylase
LQHPEHGKGLGCGRAGRVRRAAGAGVGALGFAGGIFQDIDFPLKLMDLLLCGALIEARSHERFLGLIERLPEPLARFYGSLAAAEARHAGLYLRLAARGGEPVAVRLDELADAEAELATAPDDEFRFHSGTPA